jgi:hypothetical protein
MLSGPPDGRRYAVVAGVRMFPTSNVVRLVSRDRSALLDNSRQHPGRGGMHGRLQSASPARTLACPAIPRRGAGRTLDLTSFLQPRLSGDRFVCPLA